MDHGDDQRNTSLLSQSYMHGIERITGNRNTYEEEFKISEEVFEARKKTWSWLFEKFSEISDDVELNIQTLKPVSESSGSYVSQVRIPVRKSTTQLQYWIDTGNPPCQAMEAATSESDETVSISESEATDIDEGQYSPCTSMFVNNKVAKSSEHLNDTGSSVSSVDTATYIRKNTNSGMKNDGDNRNPDNNKVGRSINAATPRVLLSRSMESPKTVDTATYTQKNTNMGIKNDGDNRNPDNNKVGRSINAATPRVLLSRSMESPKTVDIATYTQKNTNSGIKNDGDNQNPDNNKVRRTISAATPRVLLSRSMESPKTVDIATYMGKNTNSRMKKDGNNRNADRTKVGRSINTATPKVLLSRSMESPKNADVWDRISSVLHKSLSADVEKERNSCSGNGDPGIILLDENIRRKIEEGVEKGSKNEAKENKDSEVTFESKESGIGSLGIKFIDKGNGNEAKSSSESSDNILPAPNQSVFSRRRKLYTNDDSIFDLTTAIVKTVGKIKTARKSFHPALDSPSTSTWKKTASRPRFLTMWDRKSMNHSINKRNRTRSLISKSRVLKSFHVSQGGKPKVADSVKTSISPESKVSDNSLTVGADGAERSKEVDSLAEESSPKIAAATSENKSSSSLSSNDVSQIINEEIEKNLKTPAAAVCKKNQLNHSPTLNAQRFEKTDGEDDQGSIFQTSAGSSLESRDSRMRSMKLIIKNLCATDLRSLGGTDSPSTPSPNTSSKKNEDSLSNASTILLSNSKRRIKRSGLSPKVIVHDFLDLRNCCGELEKINNENWLRKKNKRLNSKTDEEEVENVVNSAGKKRENVESKKTTKEKLPKRKKLKLKNEVTASKCSAKISSKNVTIDTDGSHSSEGKTTRSKTQKLNDGRNLSNHSREIEPDPKLSSTKNPTITFTNTNHNGWESILVLESSDEEDYLKLLSNTFKSRSFRNKSSKNDEEIDPSTSVVDGKTIDDSRASKSTKTNQDCYKIVYSSSGEEEMTVETRPRIVTKKYSKRNKVKNSTESAGLTTCSREDECGYRSEGFQIENEKLEKQSPRVNKRRSERNKDKQSGEARRDYLVSQSRVNRKTKTVRKLREENVCGDNDRSDILVFEKRKDVDRVAEPKINGKENEPNKVSEHRITPVDRGKKKSRKSRRSENIDILRKIASAAEFTDSEEEPEVKGVPNDKTINKSSPKVEDKLINDVRETSIASNALLFVSDDESSDNDVVMTLYSKINAGDDSRGKNKDKEHESSGIGLKKDSASPNKRRIKDKRSAPSSSKRKTINRRCTNSTIVFRTKEYWELDSDKS